MDQTLAVKLHFFPSHMLMTKKVCSFSYIKKNSLRPFKKNQSMALCDIVFLNSM